MDALISEPEAGAPSRQLRAVLIAIWFVSLIVAWIALVQYKVTAGPSDPTPARWPIDSHLPTRPDTPTLVLFAHPKCACTRASLTELRGLLGAVRGDLTALVAFTRPGGTPDGWTRSDTWSDAESIPGVAVLEDPDGREAKRFGANTSGLVVLYDSAGSLRFSGGITPARGHVGASVQRDRLADMLSTLARTPPLAHAAASPGRPGPVFGCSLRDEGSP
jgi:hypothetical protein